MRPNLQETLNTYNREAPRLAEYFKGIGPRIDNIDYVFDLLGNPTDAKVVEIGCGDGRDGQEIANRAQWYLGIDLSESMIDIAQQAVPNGNFLVADAVDFEFPPDIDAVFAFASLLHLDCEEVQIVLQNAAFALKPGGIFYISVKHSSRYRQEVKEDDFGKRLFYFYSPELLESLAGNDYKVESSEVQTKAGTDWVEMALRRV